MKEIFETVFPGLMLMWICFIANGVFADMFEEYKAHTIARLIASGTGLWEILVSKVLRCLIICWICELLLILFTRVVFDVGWTNPVMLWVVLTAFNLSLVGFLSLVYGYARSTDLANAIIVFFFLISSVLGGSFMPFDQLPGALKFIGRWSMIRLGNYGMESLFQMMTIMYGGITLINERSEKRLSRLAAMPVSAIEIFLVKMLARMLQPALQGGVLILAGVTLFGVNLGDHPLALVPVMISFAFFCGSLGLLFGVFCRTEQQVNGIGILTSMTLAALGGCWWPLEVVPATFKTIARFTPSYWAIRGLQDVISFGKSGKDVLPECGILLAFGLVFTVIAIPAFRWE